MKKIIIFLLTAISVASCSQKKNDTSIATANTVDAEKKDSATNSFFPVTTYLQGQIILFDSLPVTILQVTTKNKQTDSAWLPKEKIKPLLTPFTAELINKSNLSSYFKETNFNDQSTEAITLMYSPKTKLPDSLSLRNWNVYINPDKETVKSIFIVRQIKENGTPVTQQLTWQSGKWAKIVNIKPIPGESSSSVEEIKWVWDLSGQ